MKAIKRALALLLVGALSFAAAGCGNGDNGGNAGEKKKNDANDKLQEYILDSDALLEKMPEELKNTTIEFINWYDPATHEEKDLFDQFTAKTGIKINTTVCEYSSYVSKVAGLLSVGETPDVMRMKYAAIGYLKMLQPISCTEFDFSGKEWDQSIINSFTFGEKCYGVNLFYTPYLMADILVYSNDIMKEMGFEDPWELWQQGKWTWPVMKDMLTTWVEQGTDYIGATIWPTDAPVVTKNGASFTKRHPDGTYTLDLMNEEVLEPWRFTMEGRAANLFTNDSNDLVDKAKPTSLFGTMTAAVVQGKTVDYFQKLRRKGTFTVVPHPKWDGVDYCLPIGEYTAFGVPIGAKNPKAVPYFLSYMCNLDNYDLSVYDEKTNPNGFFFSQQAKDVYMEILSIENRAESNVGAFDQAKIDLKSPFQWLLFMRVDATQLNQWLNTKQPILQNSIDVYNEEVLKFN